MSEEISKYEVFNKYEEAKKLLLIDYDINKDKRYLVAISALEKQLSSGWIPVSERLPDNNTKVQVTGVRYSEYTKKNIYVRFNAKYIGKHSIKVEDMWSYCEDYTWNDYVEEEDEYYVKEGWYETIENWDDYTEVYVNDYKVIAWQPLPPAYTEVKNDN